MTSIGDRIRPNQAIRVLHLTGEKIDCGGILTDIRNVESATRSYGIEHVVWVNSKFIQNRKPSLRLLPATTAVDLHPNHLVLLAKSIRSFFTLKKLLREESFDVIHTHTRGTLVAGLLISRFLHRHVLFTCHDLGRRKWFYRFASRQPRMHTLLLTLSMAAYYGIPSKASNTHVITSCCADRFFELPLTVRRSIREKDTIRLVGVGSVIEWKRWDLVLHAIGQLPSEVRGRIRFDHFGPSLDDDESRNYDRRLCALVHQYGLEQQVLFHGNSLQIDEVLNAADWFILPSTNEPLGIALVEALALGIPGLASASGGPLDIIQTGINGLLFRPGDHSDLSGKLKMVIRGEVEIVSPSEIRTSVRSRSASAVATEYKGIYSHLAQLEFERLAANRA